MIDPAVFDFSQFLASGWAVWVAMAVMCAQLALVAYLRRGQPGAQARLLRAAAPGAALMLALQAAATGAGALWVLFWLSVSYPLHLWDIARR